MRRTRHNPDASWFRSLHLRGEVTDGNFHQKMAERAISLVRKIRSIAAVVHVDMPAHQRRYAAAELTKLSSAIEVINAASSAKTFEESRHLTDFYAVRLGSVVDSMVETIDGRWRGAKQVTSLPQLEEEVIQGTLEILDEELSLATEYKRWQRKMDSALSASKDAATLSEHLVSMDPKTRESFERLRTEALNPIERFRRNPANIRHRPRSSTYKPGY